MGAGTLHVISDGLTGGELIHKARLHQIHRLLQIILRLMTCSWEIRNDRLFERRLKFQPANLMIANNSIPTALKPGSIRVKRRLRRPSFHQKQMRAWALALTTSSILLFAFLFYIVNLWRIK